MSKRRRTSRRTKAAARPRPAAQGPLTLVPSGASDTSREDTTEDSHGGPDPTRIDGRQVQVLVGLIATGVLDEHLTTLQAAIAERHSHRQRTTSRHAAARIDVGDRVRLTHGIRPLYLQGATGTVTGWVGQRAVVQLDEPTGRAIDGVVRCPPLALERLSS